MHTKLRFVTHVTINFVVQATKNVEINSVLLILT